MPKILFILDFRSICFRECAKVADPKDGDDTISYDIICVVIIFIIKNEVPFLHLNLRWILT
jgi:hypothetical protein